MRTLQTLILFGIFLFPIFSSAVELPAFKESDYFVSKQYTLEAAGSEPKETLELLQDRRLKTWKNPSRREEGRKKDEEQDYDNDFKTAFLRLRGENGLVLETISLATIWPDEAIWVSLNQENLYGTQQITYVVEQDYLVGHGTGQGFYNRYFEIHDKHIAWLTAKDSKTGKVIPIDLGDNLDEFWKLFPNPHGKGKVILQRWGDEYKNATHYERYEFDGQNWIKYERIDRGVALDTEEDFPDPKVFYKTP